jgi:bifunctional non-homologous end joining protein LigD
VNRPDVLHFDLDPVPDATFAQVCEASLIVRDGLTGLGMNPIAKTSGSKGIHVYVAIDRTLVQKDVWRFAKSFSVSIAKLRPDVLTSEYRVKRRPANRVLVDYNQNAWGRTLASVYSPRPRPGAPVSTPLTWEEIENGVAIGDFTIHNVPARVAKLGDLWKPMSSKRRRFALETLV